MIMEDQSQCMYETSALQQTQTTFEQTSPSSPYAEPDTELNSYKPHCEVFGIILCFILIRKH